MRWRKIAARLPGRSDDAVRNRWNRVNEEPTLLAGLRGGTKALIDGSNFLSDDALPAPADGLGEGGLAPAADAAAKKRPRHEHTDSLMLANSWITPADGDCLDGSRATSPTFGEASAERTVDRAMPSPGGESESAASHSTLLLTAEGAAATSAALPAAALGVAAALGAGTATLPARAGTTTPAKPRSRSGGSKRRDRAAAEAAGVPMRAIWSRAEDFVILRYVKDRGHDWKTLAEQLTARTPHAIRNRYHRLQSMALDTVEGANQLLGESNIVDPALLLGTA